MTRILKWAPLCAVLAGLLLVGADAPAAEGEGGGLTAKLLKRKETRRGRGGERTIDVLVLEITNSGGKAVVLPSPLEVKLGAKDAAGKEVQPREAPRRDEGEAAKNAGVTITVLKPGQKSETVCRTWSLNFTAKGKYKVWAEVELKEPEGEVLPGVKLWAGKLKTEEIEWDVQFVMGQRPPRGGQQQPAPTEPKKDPDKPVEDF